MMARLLISIGAGLAAAVFFIVPMKGAMSAGLTMLFAPLPLMIAGLAFAPSSALAGMAAGALLIWFVIHEYYAIFFLAWAGIPAWWLTRLAWLARPAAAGEQGDAEGLVWYPIGGLAFWSAAAGAGVAAGMVAIGTFYFGGFEAFSSRMTQALSGMLAEAMKSPGAPKLPPNVNGPDLARYAALAMPPILAGWAALSYAANLWLAGRVTLISQGMKRPWFDIPENMRLPPMASAAMAAAFVMCAISGLPRALGLIVLSALATAFALQGFAILHALSRSSQVRIGLLTALYLSTVFFFPAPAVLAALFGLAWALANSLRSGRNSPPNPNP